VVVLVVLTRRAAKPLVIPGVEQEAPVAMRAIPAAPAVRPLPQVLAVAAVGADRLMGLAKAVAVAAVVVAMRAMLHRLGTRALLQILQRIMPYLSLVPTQLLFPLVVK
jgi:hypothetical protein